MFVIFHDRDGKIAQVLNRICCIFTPESTFGGLMKLKV
jgi:hypothetical protein